MEDPSEEFQGHSDITLSDPPSYHQKIWDELLAIGSGTDEV